jgi:hyperosmotically inducible protein
MTRFGIRAAGRVLALGLALGLLASAPRAGTTSEAMSDAWITTKVKMSLLTAENVSGTAVNVDTVDGKVTLHGTVASMDEKAKAQKVAAGIKGVRDVRNLLAVVKPTAQSEMKVSDADLKTRVSKAIADDPALANSKIQVQSVNSGVVLLSGTAATLSDHLRAVENASRVPGVKRVASEIKSPDNIGDAEIWREGHYSAADAAKSTARDMWTTSAVKMRLLANDQTPGFDINVDTTDGVVTLFGMVDSQAAKTAAGAEARNVEGVKSVVNELQVVEPSKQAAVQYDDAAIQKAISNRLEANQRLADADINVDVKNGVARLTGSVESQSDRLTALTVTRASNGVKSVVDDLEIRPPDVSAR